MTDERDGDITKPDLPSGLLAADAERAADDLAVLVGIVVGANRAATAFGKLASTCPPDGGAGRHRSLEILAHSAGEIGSMWHDTRREILELDREERAAARAKEGKDP